MNNISRQKLVDWVERNEYDAVWIDDIRVFKHVLISELLEAINSGELDAEGWRPIEEAPRTDDEEQPIRLVLQGGRRYLAEWDPCAGHWQGVHAIDGIERERYYQEWPGRLYFVTHWQPLPKPPTTGG